MNKKALMLMLLLNSAGAVGELHSISLSELMAMEDVPEIKPDTAYRMLKEMIKAGYVANGMPDGRAATYFITNAGLTKIGELKNE